jgi:hypothetical protein
MKIGVFYLQTELKDGPVAGRCIGMAAEELGYDHLSDLPLASDGTTSSMNRWSGLPCSGNRMAEQIGLLRRLWSEDLVKFDGVNSVGSIGPL